MPLRHPPLAQCGAASWVPRGGALPALVMLAWGVHKGPVSRGWGQARWSKAGGAETQLLPETRSTNGRKTQADTRGRRERNKAPVRCGSDMELSEKGCGAPEPGTCFLLRSPHRRRARAVPRGPCTGPDHPGVLQQLPRRGLASHLPFPLPSPPLPASYRAGWPVCHRCARRLDRGSAQ